MSIVDRVKNICVSPGTEWPVIAGESATPGGLITGYAAPLIGVSAVAGFIGTTLVGVSVPFAGTVRVGIGAGLVSACITFVLGLVGIFILSLIINALAPTFGGQKDSTQALKVAVYSYTPGWVAGILGIVPMLGILGILAALYGIYLLYLGLPVLMRSPKDKAAGYTIVVIVCAIVLSVVTGIVAAAIGGVGAMTGGLGQGVLGGGSNQSADVQFDKNSPLGKLQELGKSMEESNRKMEAAQKSGDSAAAATAAMEGLGALLGGGKKVDPLDIEQIKPFIPATFAGLARDGDVDAEKSGFAALMVSKAEARFGDGIKDAHLVISDSGGASGLVGLASWASLQGTRENGDGSERTAKENGRTVHEVRSKSGQDEYTVIVADRFVVSATSDTLDAGALKTAVMALDLRKLEALKDAGVTKP